MELNYLQTKDSGTKGRGRETKTSQLRVESDALFSRDENEKVIEVLLFTSSNALFDKPDALIDESDVLFDRMGSY